MTKEHHDDQRQQDEVPYWNVDAPIGTLSLEGQAKVGLGLQAHVAPESYFSDRELLPLPRRGERVYVHGKPYILEPDIRLTLALDPNADPAGPIGRVVGSEWVGLRRRFIGDTQAWYYPPQHTLVLWECFLQVHHTANENDPSDPNLAALWRGVERFLTQRFPAAQHIITPHDEPLYDRVGYQRFLRDMGYEPQREGTFGKEVVR